MVPPGAVAPPRSGAGFAAAPVPGVHWVQARARLLAWWWAKAVGISGGIGLFFVAYFWVLQHPFFPVTTIPLTPLDRLVVHQAQWFPVYASLWAYVSLGPMLLCRGRELLAYALACGAMAACGLVVFMLWPTAVPDVLPPAGTVDPLAFLRTIDAGGNACPSLHVAFAVFTGLWLHKLIGEVGAGAGLRALNAAWCAAIVYSTLAIGQHVVLDVVAGGLLGAAVAALHMRWQAAPVRAALLAERG